MKYQRGILDREQVEKLIVIDCCGFGYAAARNRCLLVFMYRTGMRLGEALGLELGDVRPIGGILIARIERPKGYAKKKSPSNPRELYVDERTEGYYNAWLKHRGAEHGPLFCNEKGGKLSSAYVRRTIQKIARRAGIEKRVHCHGLRHSFAHEWYRENPGDLVRLQKALGHARLGTTETYLSQIGSTEEVISAMQEREW
jgi:integrase/recombinase XerD